MGFLSAYEGVERIDLPGGYWIDIKKCLSAGEMQVAERLLTGNPTVDASNGRASAQLDPASYRNELMCRSIVAWNLDEDDGTAWVLDPERDKRRNIARLPSSVYEQVWTKVDTQNERTSPEGRAQFRDEAERSAEDGNAGTADPGHLPDGAGTVAAPGAAPGGSGFTPLA